MAWELMFSNCLCLFVVLADSLLAPPPLGDSSNLPMDDDDDAERERVERERKAHQQKLSEAKAFLLTDALLSSTTLVQPTAATTSSETNDATVPSNVSADSISPPSPTAATTESNESSLPVPSPKRSVLLDSLDDEDDMSGGIGIGGSTKRAPPIQLKHNPASSFDLSASLAAVSSASSGHNRATSLADSLRAMEDARRAKEDARKAQLAAEQESRRKAAEEERKRREEEEQKRIEDDRKAREAEELAAQEAQRQAEEAAAAKAARHAAELKAATDGISVLKIPRSGGAKLTHVSLSKGDDGQWLVQWDSKKKSAEDSTLRISECDLTLGLISGQFLKVSHTRRKRSYYHCERGNLLIFSRFSYLVFFSFFLLVRRKNGALISRTFVKCASQSWALNAVLI